MIILERVSTYACPLILLGDINLHLDISDDPHTVKWQSVLDSHDVQLVTSPHRESHILDVVVTRSNCPVSDVCVEPPIPTMSDHWFVTASVDLQFALPALFVNVGGQF